MYTLSVSALNEQIKTLVESSFTRVLVEGELSRITFHNSGHIYFSLKDSGSALKAVMFRGNASKLRFQLKEGMKVLLDGAITLYKPRGEYQINCFSIEPSGQGALALAYEQLKEKLSNKGYFEQGTKKPLPSFPNRIAIVTSATGAALQDMLRVANTRYRALDIDIYDVLVQGDNASFDISRSIGVADKKGYDIIIVGRGGGSLEDLWAFNEESVADAIFLAQTPIISAVGHEIDWLISDFTADVRAGTPSIAMQICLPDTNELYQYIDSISSSMSQNINQKFYNKDQELKHLFNSYKDHSIQRQLIQKKQILSQLQEQFNQSISFKLNGFISNLNDIKGRYPHVIGSVFLNKQNSINSLQNTLKSNSPSLKSKRGFAQVSKNKKVIAIEELEVDELFDIQSDKVYISAQVISKEESLS